MSPSSTPATLETKSSNADSPSDSNAIYVSLKSDNIKNIHTLIDSGSSVSFLDSRFALQHNLKISNLKRPLRLTLFDGSPASSGLLYQYTDLEVEFPCSTRHPIRFLLTTLDHATQAVLGYSWLHLHNPSINWATHELIFRTSKAEDQSGDAFRSPPKCTSPVPSSPSANSSPAGSVDTSLPSPPVPDSEVIAAAAKISVSFVNAATAKFLARLPHSHSQSVLFSGFVKPPSIKANAAVPESLNPEFVSKEAAEHAELLSKVPPEYHEYLDVFSKSKSAHLPPRRPCDHKIELENGAAPPFGPIYSLSEVEQLALKTFIDENLSSGLIRPSQSPAGAPILFIKKKDGSLRLAVDYRGLNRITKKDRYPLPLIPDLLDRLRSATVFTKMDLHSAYNLVRIAEGDEWKTAFRTRYGSFEFMVMHYGLTNAPASFQRFMNNIFKDLLDVCVVVYLDDILIFSKDPSSHSQHVQEVLRRLRKHDLYAKVEKCEFSVDTTEFLGFVISPNGLSMAESKVQAIKDWPKPRKVKEVQSFLGFANFYRRFIANYSDLTVPLNRLTRKNVPWLWSPACQEAFRLLKDAFCSAPILHHFDPSLPPIVETDASDYAIAGIISVRTNDGDVHPVAFFSRTLTGAELNYDTHDKELLAIFEAFKTWRHYLESLHHTIDVLTDHKNLEYFSTTKTLSRRQARWSEYLSAFNMVIRFRPGKLGEKPDSLTRRSDYYLKGGDRDFTLANPQNCRPIFSQEQLATSLRATRLRAVVVDAASLVDIPIPLIDSAALLDDIKAGYQHDPIARRELDLFTKGTPSTRFSVSPSGLLLLDRRVYVPDHRPE